MQARERAGWIVKPLLGSFVRARNKDLSPGKHVLFLEIPKHCVLELANAELESWSEMMPRSFSVAPG